MNRRTSPLDGVRVVELGGGLAAPFAARLLADMGAEVVKVETGDGDPTRAVRPAYVADDGAERSALFEYLNLNKFGVLLDADSDRDRFDALIASADIVIVGDDASPLAQWSLDPDRLLESRPDIVVVTLTPFGLDGPKASWSATDLVLQAASGLMSFAGTRDRPPLRRGLHQSTYESGLSAAYAAEAALLGARLGRGGAVVDVSMVECVSSELVLTAAEYTFTGAISTRRPAVVDPVSSGDPVDVGTGYVSMQSNPMTPPSAYADLLGDARIAEARFQTPEGRAGAAQDLAEILREALQGLDPRRVFEDASTRGLLFGFLQTADQLMECPQLAARDALRTMPGTLGGKPWRMPFTTAVLSDTPTVYRRPAPTLGQHTAEVLPVSAGATR